MTHRENIVKAIHFETPDYIPISLRINDACWQAYPQEFLLEQIETHPLLFANHKIPQIPFTPSFKNTAMQNQPYIDDWGCLWETSVDGITGTVTKHPLLDWTNFQNYKVPDPKICMGIGAINWNEEQKRISDLRTRGEFIKAGLRHGHTFLQLCDIRGYENIIFDMIDDEENLPRLIEMVESFNIEIIKKYLTMDIDLISYAEDLGMQIGPMLSPEHFRQYIKPSYKRLMQPAKDKGVTIHMHSDGDLHSLIDDIMDCGVDIINLQDLVNGIYWIKEKLSGKTCIELDVDRQKITPFGTPAEIFHLIKEEVTQLGCRQGGLMLLYGLYPNLPLENVKAVMDAMEQYSQLYS